MPRSRRVPRSTKRYSYYHMHTGFFWFLWLLLGELNKPCEWMCLWTFMVLRDGPASYYIPASCPVFPTNVSAPLQPWTEQNSYWRWVNAWISQCVKTVVMTREFNSCMLLQLFFWNSSNVQCRTAFVFSMLRHVFLLCWPFDPNTTLYWVKHVDNVWHIFCTWNQICTVLPRWQAHW